MHLAFESENGGKTHGKVQVTSPRFFQLSKQFVDLRTKGLPGYVAIFNFRALKDFLLAALE